MQRTRSFIALLVAAACAVGGLAGCAPVYHPTTVHTPMLREAGAVQVGGFATTSGLDAHGAVAVTDRWSVIGGYARGDAEQSRCSATTDTACTDVPDDRREHRFGEIGVGHQRVLHAPTGFHGAVHAGYGRGWAESVTHHEQAGGHERRAEGQYQRVFVQPGVFFDRGPLQVAHASRLSHVHFSTFETSDPDGSGRSHLFWEPALTVRAGPDPVVFGVQSSLAVPLGPDVDYDYQRFTISVGAQVRLNELF
jgi:hypothetical protein